MSFILSPVFILFGMILFSGKPKDQVKQGRKQDEVVPAESDKQTGD